MRASDLAVFLMRAIEAQLSVLIVSSPGMGKSSIVEQVVAALRARLILSHPGVADPTDVKGLPWPSADNKTATFLPFGELALALRATEPTVWFLDDLGQAPPSVQASFMQLLLARRVNGHVLPDCVTFIAATNRRTDRAGVSGILEPVKSRFAAIVELEAHIDDWCRWLFEQVRLGKMPEEEAAMAAAFLRFRPDLLCAFTPSADLTNCPLPRTWANAIRLLALGLPSNVQHAALVGAVGGGAAVEFGAFLRLYKELPSIDGILLDPDAAAIPKEPATRYAVVTALAMRSNARNFGRVGRYAERLTDSGAGEFAALLVRDAVRKDTSITQTPDFIRLAAGDLGQLISGGF